jgi:hypothetical protein
MLYHTWSGKENRHDQNNEYRMSVMFSKFPTFLIDRYLNGDFRLSNVLYIDYFI